MKRLLTTLLLVAANAFAQTAAPAPDAPFLPQLTTMLQRNAGGHSPSEDEIRAIETSNGLRDPQTAHNLAPLLYKALTSPDSAMRQYGLATLIGMQTAPDPEAPAAKPKTSAAPAPAAFKQAVAQAITPLVPAISARLTDDSPDNRSLAAIVLGGFSPTPPSTLYAPLYTFLRRDDAIGPVGLAVVLDLLEYAPVSPRTSEAIAAYIQRTDQTTASRIELVDAISAARTQNQTVNQALLGYLDADDSALRARLILSLPPLDLDQGVFEQTRARIADLAASGQDNLEVVTAAKSIAVCWTQPRPATPCPTN